MVSKVSFSGNKVFTSEQLSAQIANDVGHPLTLPEMRALAEKIQAFYHQSGYRLAKVVVPQQDFAHMESLQLVVLEGWLRDIQIRGNSRYSSERIVEMLRMNGIVVGQPFIVGDIERALTRLNRQSGIKLSSTLQAGTETGSTDLIVDVEEANRIQGSIEANNYGSESTGENRVIPTLTLANVTGHGDEINLMAIRSIGDGDVRYEYVGYSTPVNNLGTQLHAYYAQGNVDVGSTFRVLEIEGDNKSFGVGVSQDYIRSARTIFSAEAWLESQDLEQKMLGTMTTEDNIRKLRFGISLDDSDLYGRTLISVGLHHGLGEALGGMDDESQLSSRSGAKADNDFTKITFDLARLQQVTERLLVIPRLYGQYSFDSLVSSEQWAIGGFNSVAGHEPSAYSGDSGVTASLEGRYSLFKNDHRYQLVARLDHGQIFIKDPLYGQDDREDLTGATLGILAQPIKSVDLRLDWGVPVGDKTEDSSYVYAQARYRF
ncbi:ShlB/FhaC/HecB family hemolysin secretion/activation protein [Pseudomonas lopnurensis]|uniref:ShlB/FhaC/HecB family hemolysin secretion/activation protein n=1 Tax=Pseudomonas lopnurensis TaxID=1477517 RepID=UPI001F18A402|nr:ShlB/FhaC/HecB family hemolysin secretion/activation protein [Pseudomonas lopnurensis]